MSNSTHFVGIHVTKVAKGEGKLELCKLQGLPQAAPLESGAFSILILFIATVLFLMLLSCFHCCCGKPKYQGSRVQPLESI
uniref:Uncharacterized protein n=1 Tax=Xiphophorus couchianus TaxID=32473 RepID=A0A3B5L0P4_9TELE